MVRLTDHPDMTLVVDLDIKPQNKQNTVYHLRKVGGKCKSYSYLMFEDIYGFG